jgi:hypothetical protein
MKSAGARVDKVHWRCTADSEWDMDGVGERLDMAHIDMARERFLAADNSDGNTEVDMSLEVSQDG